MFAKLEPSGVNGWVSGDNGPQEVAREATVAEKLAEVVSRSFRIGDMATKLRESVVGKSDKPRPGLAGNPDDTSLATSMRDLSIVLALAESDLATVLEQLGTQGK